MASKKELERRIKRLEDQLSKELLQFDWPWYQFPKVTVQGQIDAIKRHLGIRIYATGPVSAKVATEVLPKKSASTKAKVAKSMKK